MGATLEQDLAINFLDALKNIWSGQSGTWQSDATGPAFSATCRYETGFTTETFGHVLNHHDGQ
jgi:hypothetical protein